MKKLIVLLILVALVVLPAVGASYANNNYQKQARNYSRLAQEAFDAGEYDQAVEYAELASEYTALSEEYIRTMVARADAQKKLSEVSAQIAYARTIHGDSNYPNYFNDAVQKYASAMAAFSEARYEDALALADGALVSLCSIQDVNVLPKYYVVRTWAGDRDCFWNIAARAYVYDSPWQWKVLYEANKDKLPDPSNPNIIEEGMVLEIPSLNGEIRSGTYDPTVSYASVKK